MKTASLALLALLLVACQEDSDGPPTPVALTDDALSHYCQMWIGDHAGPKGQIHLEGYDQPVFFAQVRDALAYLKGQERDARILAIYVSDMAQATSWEQPGESNWLDAQQAHFVLGSRKRGGMGAPEVVPFGNRDAAEAFMASEGGEVVTLSEIPVEAVLGAVEIALPEAEEGEK